MFSVSSLTGGEEKNELDQLVIGLASAVWFFGQAQRECCGYSWTTTVFTSMYSYVLVFTITGSVLHGLWVSPVKELYRGPARTLTYPHPNLSVCTIPTHKPNPDTTMATKLLCFPFSLCVLCSLKLKSAFGFEFVFFSHTVHILSCCLCAVERQLRYVRLCGGVYP